MNLRTDELTSFILEQDYPLAVDLYSKAIEIFPTAVLYANR